MTRQTVAAAFLVVAVGGLGVSFAAAETFDHATFDRILGQHVRGEQVDYLTIRKNDLVALDAYLVYNAMVIQAVIENFRAGYSVSADDFAVFKQPLARVGGKTMSLNDLENSPPM